MDDQLRAFVAAQVAGDLLRYRLQRQVIVTSPAAGAEWVTTVPGGIYWELLAAKAVLTTSAVVANRNPSLVIQDPDAVQSYRANVVGSVAASSGGTCVWAAGLGFNGQNGALNGPLPSPPLIVQPSFNIRTTTGALDVGDQWSAIVLTVREWSAGQIAQHFEKVLADTFALRIADREI